MRGGTAADRQAVGAAVRDACTRVGFFYAAGHGVDAATIDGAFAAAQAFFDQSLDAKMAVHIDRSNHFRGYTPLLGENTNPDNQGDLHEVFDLALELAADDPDVRAGKTGYGPNQWPADLPGFREAVLAYYGAVRAFGEAVFRAFALALELDEAHFAPLIDKPMGALRLLHYPSQDGPIDERQIGVGAHSDYECFTILAQQDVPALQVLNSAGEWVMADPIPGTFVVNVGDMMARWTNDYFASTVHRAIDASGRRRYSIPFFFGPNPDTPLAVLPTCQGPDWPAKYPTISAGEYVTARLAATLPGAAPAP
jgi:isopenicillin N synthase-like dioxygenase